MVCCHSMNVGSVVGYHENYTQASRMDLIKKSAVFQKKYEKSISKKYERFFFKSVHEGRNKMLMNFTIYYNLL